MALEIKTGYTGGEGIGPSDDAAFNASVFGSGNYVLGTGSKFAATMVDSNTLRISDGVLLMNGRYGLIKQGQHEDVAIKNGTQGKKANDIVVARYEKNASSKLESMSFRVVEGTPGSAAVDPKWVEGNILEGDLIAETPLYRVPKDGITVGTLVPMFETIAPMKDAEASFNEFRDSVSQKTTTAKSASLTVQPLSSNTASIDTGIPRSKLPVISGWEQGSWELSVHRVKLVEKSGQMQVQISLYNPLGKQMAANVTVYIDHY